MRKVTWALVRLNRRIENCWVGDLIGVCGIFVLLFTGLMMAPVLK